MLFAKKFIKIVTHKPTNCNAFTHHTLICSGKIELHKKVYNLHIDFKVTLTLKLLSITNFSNINIISTKE